jgi:hypothetical protein
VKIDHLSTMERRCLARHESKGGWTAPSARRAPPSDVVVRPDSPTRVVTSDWDDIAADDLRLRRIGRTALRRQDVPRDREATRPVVALPASVEPKTRSGLAALVDTHELDTHSATTTWDSMNQPGCSIRTNSSRMYDPSNSTHGSARALPYPRQSAL